MSATFQQAILPIGDAATFGSVKTAIDQAFSAQGIESFLKSLEKSKLRIRDFELVAKAGKLGPDTAANYAKLGDSDQGQVRELYLASLEKVPMDLRDKYFKLYAYY